MCARTSIMRNIFQQVLALKKATATTPLLCVCVSEMATHFSRQLNFNFDFEIFVLGAHWALAVVSNNKKMYISK